ncbi:flavin reductase like domain-containing protein [Hypoxylon sp. FL1284]|nr:flavin reductase like domain-containing protein [Hypoxylon sp. FL1284]
MKSFRSLRWALQSATPRCVAQRTPFHTTTAAQVSFWTRWRNRSPTPAGNHTTNTPRENSTLQQRLDKVYGYNTEPSDPRPHRLARPTRAVMRQLPHPVVVITTLENTRNVGRLREVLNKKFPRPIPRAMTVSSFTSLSINPVPRVTFNVTLPSTTYDAIVKSGRFNAHILSGDDQGARIADLFTRGNRPLAVAGTPEGGGKSDLGVLAGLSELGVQVVGQEYWQREWEEAGEYGEKVLSVIREGGYRKDVTPPLSGTLPTLQGQGIMHILQCKFRDMPNRFIGNHAIVVGEVDGIIQGKYGDEDDIALAYADRAYRRSGDKLLDRPAAEPVPSTEENAPEPVEGPTEISNDEKASLHESTNIP